MGFTLQEKYECHPTLVYHVTAIREHFNKLYAQDFLLPYRKKKTIKNKIRTNYGKLCLFSCNFDVFLVACSHMHGSISLREIPQARNLKKTTNILCRLFILDFKNFHYHHPVLYYQSKQYHLQYANKYREKTSFFVRFSKFEFFFLNFNF